MKQIRIIHTTDIHSSFESFLQMATLIKQLKLEHSILLDAGDFNDFSNQDTFASDGYVGLKLLNHLNYNALCIGNNEGFQDLSMIQKMASYHLVHLLSCNLLTNEKKEIIGIKKSMIYHCDAIRFLIIGVSPFHESYNIYYHMHQLHAISPYSIIQQEIQKYKGQYDVVLVLSHLGLKTDILLTQSIPEIDMIVGGHSHLTIPPVRVNQTILCQAGVRGSHVGYLDLFFENNQLKDFSGACLTVNPAIKEDSETKELYACLKRKTAQQLAVKMATIPIDLHYSIENESDLTNLIADYLKNHYDAEFSFIHSGLTEKNLKAGVVTKKDILEVCCGSPLQIVTMKIKGKYLIEALMHSSYREKCYDTWRRPGFRGKFLGKIHVSYNCQIIEMQHHISFIIDGQICEEERYYQIVTTDYFLRGMGYEELKNNQDAIWYKEQIFEVVLKALQDEKSFKEITKKRWIKQND